MKNYSEEQKKRIINKIEMLSDKYHKLSLLFYELSQSLKIESRNKSFKEFKKYIKSLNIDIERIIKISKEDIKILKGGLK